MFIRNIHGRVLEAPAAVVGRLIDSLSSPEDALWPRDRWPSMRFDRALQVGACGGHGPIRYTVQAYGPGRYVECRFTAPRGFHGYHAYLVEPVDHERTRLRHVLAMRISGLAWITWPLVFRPLHDALIEDSLDTATRSLGHVPHGPGWTPWVRGLRWLLARGRRAAGG